MGFQYNPITGFLDLVGASISPSGTITVGNLIDNGLTANRAVASDASKQLVSSATTDTQLAYLSGTTGTTGTNLLVLATAPTLSNPIVGTQSQGDSSTKAASTSYVDTAVANAIAGVNPAVAVQAATTAASDTSSYTYNNGVSGVGATLTGVANTALTVDGYTFTAIGQRLLVKNDTQSPSGAFNGVYYVTQVQAALLPVILTRALDYNQPSDINNTGAIPVVNGTVNGTTTWVLSSQVTTVGTSPLTYTRFSINPTTIQTNTLTSAHILVGNSSNVATDVAVSGDLTLANTGAFTIANLAVTNAKIANSTIDLTAKVTGTLPVANGGTGQASNLTQYGVVYGSTTTAMATTAAGTANYPLVANSSAAPTFQQLGLTTGVTGVLPYANGGTNASTAWTQGSVLFAGASGLAQDNSKLFYDATNHRLAIGTTSATSRLWIKATADNYDEFIGIQGTGSTHWWSMYVSPGGDFYFRNGYSGDVYKTVSGTTSRTGLGGISFSTTDSVRIRPQAGATTDNTLTLVKLASQTGDFFRCTDTDGTTVLSKIDISGNGTFANIIDSGLTASRAVVSDGSKQLTSSATTATEIGYVSGVTSAIQTQLNNKITASAGDLAETSFTAANNQSSAANVTGLAFANATVRSADILLSIVRNTTYAQYKINVIQGASSWYIDQSYLGDVTGLTFTITSAGQVQYTSTNTGSTAAIRFRALTTSV